MCAAPLSHKVAAPHFDPADRTPTKTSGTSCWAAAWSLAGRGGVTSVLPVCVHLSSQDVRVVNKRISLFLVTFLIWAASQASRFFNRKAN